MMGGDDGREGTVPASKKVGTQLLVSPHIRARAQKLALVRQESVAEIWRIALEGSGLSAMENAHHSQLREVDRALQAIGGDPVETLDFITRAKLGYGDLFDSEGRPIHQLPARATAVAN
jgi:hypothetical protein